MPKDIIWIFSQIMKSFPPPSPTTKPNVMPTPAAMKEMSAYLYNAIHVYGPKPTFDRDYVNRMLAENRINEAIKICEAARWVVMKSRNVPKHYHEQVRDCIGHIKCLRGFLKSSDYGTPEQFQTAIVEIQKMITYGYEVAYG